MNHMITYSKLLAVTSLVAIVTLNSVAADTVVIESRKADGSPNSPAWAAISGKWGQSKNKSRAAVSPSFVATNVSICVTSAPLPAIKISPEGLQPDMAYEVEVSFRSTPAQAASADLIVAVSADGVSANTIPTNTVAFQNSGADKWNLLGTITPSTKQPSLTFKYVSGTLSKESRWYADAIRFTPASAAKKAE